MQRRINIVPSHGSTVLPRTQAGYASWGGPALCTIPKGALNRMTPEHSDSQNRFEQEAVDALKEGETANVSDGHSKITRGARAMNRLLLSLWFLLIPMIWPSSDWIGLIVLSQAFFIAARLIRPAIANANSAVSPEGAVLDVNDGEGCAEG